MEERFNNPQSPGSQPEQREMAKDRRWSSTSLARSDKADLRELEWTAVFLFCLSCIMMIFSHSLYLRDESWGLAPTALSAATAVMLLLSVMFLVFGATKRAKVALGVGMLGLMVWFVLIVIQVMQYISKYSD